MRPVRKPPSQTVTLQAPVKGWTSDTFVEAEKGTAVVLDNWVAEADAIRLRRGYAEHATGVSGGVEKLLVWQGATAAKMFAAAAGGTIYDVSSSGAASSSYSTSRTDGAYKGTMFATPAGQYLYLVNGTDAPVHYNGSSWAVPTITGVTASTLCDVWPHQSRLWFIEINSTNAWYLPIDSIAGAASKLPVGSLLSRGGFLQAGGTWTLDSGTGVDDLLVLVSSEGEVVVYAGTDPSSIQTWALQGVYHIGKPIGRNCLRKVGGDLVVVTEQGVVALSTALQSDLAAMQEKALTKRIRVAYSSAVKRAADVAGWEIETYPRQQLALLNIPASGSEGAQQFVYNVTNGAWSRWIGYEATCWALFDDKIYFGTDAGTVYQADTGGTDNGAPITARMLPAFDQLGAQGRLKHVKMIRPLIFSDVPQSAIRTSVACAVEYRSTMPVLVSANVDATKPKWDAAHWDEAVWGGTDVVNRWRTGGNIGTAVAPQIDVTVSTLTSGDEINYRVIGFDMVHEVGGVL